MNIYKLFLVIISLVVFNACKESGCTDPAALNHNPDANQDDESCSYECVVKVSFTLSGNNMRLSKYGTYEKDMVTFRLENLKYYLSELVFDNQSVKDVFLYDINVSDNSFFFNHDKTSISTISLGLGLTEELNSSDPATFENSHPLSFFQGTYWNMPPASYIFVMAELKADTLGSEEFDLPLSYHLAHKDLYRPIQINQNIDLSPSDTTVITINLELSDLTNSIDISEQIPHQSVATTETNIIMDNLENALTIQ